MKELNWFPEWWKEQTFLNNSSNVLFQCEWDKVIICYTDTKENRTIEWITDEEWIKYKVWWFPEEYYL